jgi:hypothetical protein
MDNLSLHGQTTVNRYSSRAVQCGTIGTSTAAEAIRYERVAVLNASYNIPFSWRYNLARIFPHDAKLTREDTLDLSIRY